MLPSTSEMAPVIGSMTPPARAVMLGIAGETMSSVIASWADSLVGGGDGAVLGGAAREETAQPAELKLKTPWRDGTTHL